MRVFFPPLMCLGLVFGSSASEPKRATGLELLNEFQATKKKEGWKLQPPQTPPTAPKPQSAIVQRKGNLDGLKEKQQVTLKFGWVVVSKTIVKPDSAEVVTLEFNTSDSVESVFELSSTSPPGLLELDISKKKSQAAGGTTIKARVRTAKQETKMIVGLQQVVQVYSDEKTPRLLATGYLRRYSFSTFVKKDSK